MRVLVVGAGLMGSQIGCEYALGGHHTLFVARHPAEAERRVKEALALVSRLELFTPEEVSSAAARMEFGSDVGSCDLVVESVPEDLALKADVLGRAAREAPGAVLASNTSSLSITKLGDAVGAPERTVGTHYWNPPLLMPLVEVIPGERTAAATVAFVRETLESLGKHPVAVERDVPGFVWNRLQLALLREALWLVEHGVASPETVDEVVRSGLARRWRLIGPFETVALGGVETFTRVAANLFPLLSNAERADELGRWVKKRGAALARLRARRDEGLVEELKRERMRTP